MNESGFYHRLNRRWAEADPRLLWRPCDEIYTVLKCISHRRPVRHAEARRIARAMAERLTSGPGEGSVLRAVLGRWNHPDEFLWMGRIRGCRSFMQPWEKLEREARAEGRQFCLISKHRAEVSMRLYRRERELDELRRLTNKLLKTITERNRAKRLSEQH